MCSHLRPAEETVISAKNHAHAELVRAFDRPAADRKPCDLVGGGWSAHALASPSDFAQISVELINAPQTRAPL